MDLSTIKGEKALQFKFRRLANQIKKNKTPMYKRIGIKVLNAIDENFRTESHDGKRWQSLSDLTVFARRRGPGAGSSKILQDTGTLRRSFDFDANNSQVRVGTNIEYAQQHEFGLGVPERKMIPSDKKVLEISVKVADDYIDEQLKKGDLK
jgi:phage virion morphogenesis protein